MESLEFVEQCGDDPERLRLRFAVSSVCCWPLIGSDPVMLVFDWLRLKRYWEPTQTFLEFSMDDQGYVVCVSVCACVRVCFYVCVCARLPSQ